MKKEARETAEEISRESEAIRTRFVSFRTKYKQLLESELQKFDSLSMEIFPELGEDYDVQSAVLPQSQEDLTGPVSRDTLKKTKR